MAEDVKNPNGTPIQGDGGSVDNKGVVTAQAIREANSHILKDDVVRKVTQIRPSATPLDTILRELSGKRAIKSFVARYFSSGVRPTVTRIKADIAATSGSSVQSVHTVTLENEQFVDKDDLLLFQGVNGGDGKELVGHVTKVNSGSTPSVEVMLLNGTGDNKRGIPQITTGTAVTRLSTAMNERDARSADYAIIPEDDYNYCQIIMSTMSQGLVQRMLEKEIDFDLTDLKDATIYDFRRKCEGALLNGSRALLNIGGRDYYHMNGIIRPISEHKISTGRSTKVSNAIVEWTKEIFVGNNGSDTRYAFAGDGVLEWLSKGLVSETYKKIESTKTEVVAGIRFNKIETEFGTLMLRHHPDFGSLGMDNKILVFDPDYIELRQLKPMGIRKIDNAANGTDLSESYVIEEAFTNVVTNPGVHALIELND